MSTNQIVDLSADDCNDEVLRKKINRKKMNELKRYIPFLEYISKLDPVKNKNYTQLLRWLLINKEFPARMAATCENNIILKYNKIKNTTELPAHIVEVFTEKDAILISDEDDEQPKAQSPKDLETIDLEDDEPRASSGGTTLKKDEHTLKAPSNVGLSAASGLPSSIANLSATNNANSASLSIAANSTIKHQSQANKGSEDSLKIVLEEGEILSDGDDIKENRDKNETPSKNIQKITTKTSESIFSTPSEDDIINQDLFKRIDCFDEDEDTAKHIQTLSSKEKEEEAQTTILRQKNLESELFSRRSPKITRTDSLSTISSEDTFMLNSHKKKKKKRKRKKKNHDQGNRYVSEVEIHSERSERTCRRETCHEEVKSKTPKKSKKSSKKRNKEQKHARPLYISDGEEDDVFVINKKNNESNFRESPNDSNRKHDSLHTVGSSEPPTVVLSDSNDEEVSQINSLQEKNAEPPIEPVSEIVEIPPSPKSVVELATESEPQQNKEGPSIKNVMQDINNMNLNELNDIYTKLCDATGIQLEKLLIDLVGKSAQENRQNPQVDVDAQSQTITPVAQTDFRTTLSEENLNQNNNNQNSQYREDNPNMFSFQQHQTQYQYSQNLAYQLEPHNHPQQEIQRQPQINVPCQMPAQLPYQHTLRPGLNLNDPRIVQRLKQIKDSPIYNLSIRESASLLMNRHGASMPKRPIPVPEVTSKTATTYGEHKRLRELEKKSLERQASKTSTVTANHTSENLNTGDKVDARVVKSIKLTKCKKSRAERNLSESSVEESYKRVNETEVEKTSEPMEKTVMRFSVNKPLSRSSSLSEDSVLSSEKRSKSKENISSGRITPFEMEKVVNIVLSAIGPVNDDTSKKLKKLSKVQFESTNSFSQENDGHEKSLQKSPNSSDMSAENKDDTKDNMVKRRGRPASKKRNENSNSSKKSPSKPFGIRELNNLNCTFLDYKEIFEKNWLATNGGKRRCIAFSNLTRDQSSSDEISENSDDRKSVLSDKVSAAPIKRRRQTCSALQDNLKSKKDNPPPIKVVLRRLSEGGTFGIDNGEADNSPADAVEVETEKQPKPVQIVHHVKVKLKKLSFDEIKMKTNTISNASKSKGVGLEQKSSMSPSLGFNTINSSEEPILVPFSSEPVDCLTKSYPRPLRHLNVNINMTLNSTKVCAICNKRSIDLTSHYVLQHKTESYVSRLTSAEIKNLEKQIKLATLNRKRYKITCVFCQDELEVHHFVQFHAHYSYHTGEYGFKCDVCEVVKPYREDVKSHQLRTSRCRNGKIRTNYLYQSDLKVIYLYICNLCNFVQLNEANIHKHQRDHHSFRFEEPQHVKKCIICALDDAKVINELLPLNEMESLEREEEYVESGGDLVSQEQEFVHEFPLDIKDVLINLENENNSQSREIENSKCEDSDNVSKDSASAEGQFIQSNELMDSSKKVTFKDGNVATQKSVEEEKNTFSRSTSSTVTDKGPQWQVSKSLNNQMSIINIGMPCVENQNEATIFSSNMVSKQNANSASATEHILPPYSKTYSCTAKKQFTKLQKDLPIDSNALQPHNAMTIIPGVDIHSCTNLQQQKAFQSAIWTGKGTTNGAKRENQIDKRNTSTSPSPETLLGQLHGIDDHNSVMTIVHSKDQMLCVEHHQPYEDAVDIKPDINEIKIENSEDLEISVSSPSQAKQISYRKVPPGISYFGLYKCMSSECWFSTNEAEKYVRHVETHKVTGQKLILCCAYCSIKSFSSKQLVRHIRTRHSMSLYQCSVCTYRSMVAGNVCFHIEMNHKDFTGEKCIFICAGRVRTLENKLAALKEKAKERINRLICRDCPAQYYSLSLMKSHLKTTQHNINISCLAKYGCIFCEVESNSSVEMQIHLVSLHPNDMCYVVERELNNATDEDSIENLKLIDLSPSITTGIKGRVAEFKEEVSETVQTTNKTELNLIERILPLLELITENTGVYRSELYKCTVCGGSFFTYDLWLSHVQSRHDINDKVTCPYCPQQITLEEVIIHFETHLRHEYICLHCVKTFGSKLEQEDHFDTNHKNFERFIEKPIVCSNLRKYNIMKGDEGSTDWIPILEKFIEVLRSRCIEKFYENRCSEWCFELVQFCFEDIDIPQFVSGSGTVFKCLVNSCGFESPDENTFDLHLNQHTVPINYDCPYCVKNLHKTWESIKDHYMLHRCNTSYLCCVCKFVHHNRSVVTDHIRKFHNSRDVPIITLWRDATKCKTSLAIVIPTNKMGLVTTTTCFCCGQGMANGKGVMKHLFDAHGMVLCSKCELCGDILLHGEEIEKHAEKHGSTVFTIRYDILSPSLYDLCVNSISPFRIDIKRKTEKRVPKDETESPNKRIKLDESLCLNIKQEITKVDDEDIHINNDNNFEKPSCSIKCVNIDRLVSSTFKPAPNQPTQDSICIKPTQGSICIKPIKDLQIKPLPVYPSNTSKYSIQNSHQLSIEPIEPHQQTTQHLNIEIQPIYIPPTQQAPHMAPPMQYAPSQNYSNYNIQSIPLTNTHHQAAQLQHVQCIPNQPTTNSVPQYYSNNNIQSVVHQQSPQIEPANLLTSLSVQPGPIISPKHLSDLQPQNKIMSITLSNNQGIATISSGLPPPASLSAQLVPSIQQKSQNNIVSITLPNNQGVGTISRGLPPPYTNSSYNNGPHCSYQNTKTITPTSTFRINPICVSANPVQAQNCNQAPQTLEEIAKTIDLTCPEILPICGNCHLECNSFVMLLSHFHAVHESKSRFLFRIDRKVECVYCPYRGSISSFTAHNKTFHPGKVFLCRSVSNHNRCGMCNGVFNYNPATNITDLTKCNCPAHKRVIADCITMDSLQLLQKYGKKWYGFLCQICNKLFNTAVGCSNHITNVHNQSDIFPKMWPLKCLLFSCFLCESTAMSVQNLIVHISVAHTINSSTCTLENRLMHYKKIRLIYPRGLIVTLSDLSNAGYDEENLKKDIQTVDATPRN